MTHQQATPARSVFLHLLHGRDVADQDMTDWGFAGPILGPFASIHWTYAAHLICENPDGETLWLEFHDDMLTHEGKFYGDFEICGGHDP